MRGPWRRRRRCLSSLLFIPCLKFPLTIRIYVSAPRAMKHGPCITHHGSQEQPFLKQLCQFVMYAPKFLYVKHCWTDKGHFWNEKARDFNTKFAHCEKRQ